MEICNKERCTGCFACINTCPKHCIQMEEIGVGHIYPQIDEAACLNCGACQRACPQNKSEVKNSNIEKHQTVYAAWSLDEKERKTSSSGGLAYYFGKQIIGEGGIVYGCSSSVELEEIRHIRCQTKEELELLKGSKYAQSFIKDTYSTCEKDLLEGKEVLFIGTPCQIDGLRSFLNKEYDNLFTIDLVCHGVPPQKLLFEHLKEIAKDAVSVTFRGEEGFVFTIKTKDGSLKRSQFSDLYFIGFNKALYYRESCYQCKYAQKERVGDITLGDFWGLGKIEPFNYDQSKGVSLCILNNEKGKILFERFKTGLFFEERSLTEAVAGNANLRRATIPHKNKERFAKIYSQKGFKKAAKKTLKKNILKYRILRIIQNNTLLRKIFSKIF